MTQILSEQALKRRLKRHFLKKQHDYFAICAPGFEELLERELLQLQGVVSTSPEQGGVTFSGPLELIYLSNLHLRSAHRVLLRIGTFLAQSYPMLFGHIKRVNWELYLGFQPTYSLSISAKKSRLRHHKRIAESVRAGIDQALAPLELRPQPGKGAALTIHVRIFQDRCTLSLDTSGEHLHKRHFKQAIGAAPLRETLAASLLLGLDIEQFDLILDPMCGSGTLLLEAAQLLSRTPPGLNRSFALEHMPSHQARRWKRLKHEARQAISPLKIRLMGSDVAGQSLDASRQAFLRAGFLDDISLVQEDVTLLNFNLLRDSAERPLVLSNLPYGVRLMTQMQAQQFAAELCRNLKHHAAGWTYAFITKDPKWLHTLEPDAIKAFLNGGIRVALVRGVIAR